MATVVNLYEAKTQLSSLVERAAAGEEIVIAKAGRPRARLLPLEQPKWEPVKLGQQLLEVAYLAPDFYDDLPQETFSGPVGLE